MTKEVRILRLKTRIDLLSHRQTENGRIIAKLKRQMRNLENN